MLKFVRILLEALPIAPVDTTVAPAVVQCRATGPGGPFRTYSGRPLRPPRLAHRCRSPPTGSTSRTTARDRCTDRRVSAAVGGRRAARRRRCRAPAAVRSSSGRRVCRSNTVGADLLVDPRRGGDADSGYGGGAALVGVVHCRSATDSRSLRSSGCRSPQEPETASGKITALTVAVCAGDTGLDTAAMTGRQIPITGSTAGRIVQQRGESRGDDLGIGSDGLPIRVLSGVKCVTPRSDGTLSIAGPGGAASAAGQPLWAPTDSLLLSLAEPLEKAPRRSPRLSGSPEQLCTGTWAPRRPRIAASRRSLRQMLTGGSCTAAAQTPCCRGSSKPPVTCPVLFDSGVRSGTDVIKALAMLGSVASAQRGRGGGRVGRPCA